MKNILEVLKSRELLEAVTSENLGDLLQAPQKVYVGFDPTADSLHLGHLIPLIVLSWFQKCGHTPVVLIGGATGMIGDPSGKSEERSLLDEKQLEINLAGMRKNIEQILNWKHTSDDLPLIVNNYDWFKEFSFIEFLRDVAKSFRLSVMLSRESVKQRLNSEEGMSMTEFSYQMLQGYDFLHLYDNYDVTIQIGGADQWGNIVSGMEFVRKVRGQSVYGLTFPLLTSSDGKKFGKSEKGAIWLSPERMSPYEFYQYLFKTSDADVIKFMRMLTFMDLDEIANYEEMMKSSDYVPNTAQKCLAEEITRLVHGENGLQNALNATHAARPGSDATLDAVALANIAKDMPSAQMNNAVGLSLLEIACKVGLVSSKGEGRRLIQNKGFYLNNDKVLDEKAALKESDLIDGRLFLLGSGKKKKLLVSI